MRSELNRCLGRKYANVDHGTADLHAVNTFILNNYKKKSQVFKYNRALVSLNKLNNCFCHDAERLERGKTKQLRLNLEAVAVNLWHSAL